MNSRSKLIGIERKSETDENSFANVVNWLFPANRTTARLEHNAMSSLRPILIALTLGFPSLATAQDPDRGDGTVHVAVSGGGFYSQANATGWLAGILDLWPEADLADPLANVQSLSGISGGSWFLTQIGYSQAFVEQLRTNRDGWTQSNGYLGQVRTTFEGYEAFNCSTLPEGALEDLCDTVSILNPVFSVLQASGDITDPRWQETCEDIVFNPFGMKAALQGIRMADTQSRPEWAREKDFIFTTVASGWDDVLCNRYVFPFSLLNQYVGSTNGSNDEPFAVPMLWSGVGPGRVAPDLLPGGDLELRYYEQDMSASDGVTTTIDRRAASDITVLGATAASSAAGGIAASYEFYRRTLDFSPQISNTLSNFLRNLSVPLRNTDAGFRTRGNIPSARYDNLAAEQYLRISDGGIHDSTSVGALMHHLHRNDQLNDFQVILIDPMFYPLVSCNEQELPLPRSIAFLFGYSAQAPFLCLELGGVPGPNICIETDPCTSSVPTAQIQLFEPGDWPSDSDVAWSWQGIDAPTGQIVDLKILSIPVTTVENLDLDLPAGRSGTLHVLAGAAEFQDGIPLSGGNLDSYDALYRSIRRALTAKDDPVGRNAIFDALNTSPVAPCVADLDGDDAVGGPDLAALLSKWGTDDPTCDLDGDGIVGGAELSIILANWGPCTPDTP